MCAKAESSPVVFVGGQLARITGQRGRRDPLEFVKPSGAPLLGGHYTGGVVGDHREAFFAR